MLDLKQPEGRAVLHRLLDRADVFLTNYRPAALARGFAGRSSLRSMLRLVYASATGFGEAGPEAPKLACDTLV